MEFEGVLIGLFDVRFSVGDLLCIWFRVGLFCLFLLNGLVGDGVLSFVE